MTRPLFQLGGEGPVLHWAPATGFPLSTYQPLYEPLAARYRNVAVPPRPLWPDIGPPPDRPASWADHATDILGGLREHGIGPVIAIGHSAGGVASLLAAIRDPDTVRGVVLFDPTILPPALMTEWRALKAGGWKDRPHPLATRARERRSDFTSHDEAFDYWRDRAMFHDWSDAALRRYVEGALRPTPDGGWTLIWTGGWEAHTYESIHLDTWDDLTRLDPKVPLLVIRGGTSETFTAESAKRFQDLVSWATMATVPGYGHLFPQAAPAETLAILDDWLRRTAG